jgi:hypothetical protein
MDGISKVSRRRGRASVEVVKIFLLPAFSDFCSQLLAEAEFSIKGRKWNITYGVSLFFYFDTSEHFVQATRCHRKMGAREIQNFAR